MENDVRWARIVVPGQAQYSIAQRMKAYRVQGLSIAVIRDFRIEWAKGGGYRPGDQLPTLPQILDGAHPAMNDPVRSLYPPGIRYRYSGGGTEIAQQVVMDVTRRPYADFMREEVLVPLGMMSSSFEQPGREGSSLKAHGYDQLGQPIPGGSRVMPEQAAAGLWTTATDLARFLIETQRGLRGDAETLRRRAQLGSSR